MRGFRESTEKSIFTWITNKVMGEEASVIEKRLIDLLQKGYVLHGSQNKIEGDLEPRNAAKSDLGDKPEDKQTAVYGAGFPKKVPYGVALATVRMVLAHATTRTTGSYGISTKGSGETILTVNGEYKPKSGFVYVLPSKGFSPAGPGQLVNPNPVKPDETIEVKPEDYTGKIEIKKMKRQ
jgi:hypothetical protein